MKIIKRDGTIVDYDGEKIRVAIGKANNEVQNKEKVSEEEINDIIKYIEGLKKKKEAKNQNLDTNESGGSRNIGDENE